MMDFSPAPTKNYEEQRFDRLAECVDEYLGGTGNEMGLDFLVRDLKKACLNLSAYHRKVLDDCIVFSDHLP